jgi:8-oxo-dGTP pyrophosphatase MutT (NUDIX family)
VHATGEALAVSPTLVEVRRALEARPPARLRPARPKAAAVAVVLRAGDDGLSVLLIRRADHPADVWSGHVAFPGGRAQPGESSVETAMRETAEEVGLDLRRFADTVGALDEIEAVGGAQATGLSIQPWVFALHAPPPPFTLSEEVASAHWVTLAELLDPRRQAPFPYVHEGAELVLPSIRVGGLTVWGLTYLMIADFQATLGARPP